MIVFSIKYNINDQNKTTYDVVTYTRLMAVIKHYFVYSTVSSYVVKQLQCALFVVVLCEVWFIVMLSCVDCVLLSYFLYIDVIITVDC